MDKITFARDFYRLITISGRKYLIGSLLPIEKRFKQIFLQLSIFLQNKKIAKDRECFLDIQPTLYVQNKDEEPLGMVLNVDVGNFDMLILEPAFKKLNLCFEDLYTDVYDWQLNMQFLRPFGNCKNIVSGKALKELKIPFGLDIVFKLTIKFPCPIDLIDHVYSEFAKTKYKNIPLFVDRFLREPVYENVRKDFFTKLQLRMENIIIGYLLDLVKKYAEEIERSIIVISAGKDKREILVKNEAVMDYLKNKICKTGADKVICATGYEKYERYSEAVKYTFFNLFKGNKFLESFGVKYDKGSGSIDVFESYLLNVNPTNFKNVLKKLTEPDEYEFVYAAEDFACKIDKDHIAINNSITLHDVLPA